MARNVGLQIPYEKAWEKVKAVTGWTKDKQLADFLHVQPGTISGARQRDNFPLQWAFKVAQEFGCSTDSLVVEDVPIRSQPDTKDGQPIDDMASMEAAAQISPDAINVQELLNMTAEVLVSNTVYRPALAANIKAFHRSIALEMDNQELRSRIERLEERQEAERKDMNTKWLETENRLKRLEQENADLKRGKQEQAAQG